MKWNIKKLLYFLVLYTIIRGHLVVASEREHVVDQKSLIKSPSVDRINTVLAQSEEKKGIIYYSPTLNKFCIWKYDHEVALNVVELESLEDRVKTIVCREGGYGQALKERYLKLIDDTLTIQRREEREFAYLELDKMLMGFSLYEAK